MTPPSGDRRPLVVVALAAVFGCSQSPAQKDLGAGRPSDQDAADASRTPPVAPGAFVARVAEIRVELHPENGPYSRFVAADARGRVQAVHFDPYTARVLALSEQTSTGGELTDLRARLTAPDLPALFTADLRGGSEVAVEGSVFSLEIDGGLQGRLAGVLSEAPAPARELVEHWLELLVPGGEDPLAPGYVRSERMADERAKALRDAGRLEFHETGALHEALIAPATAALDSPGRFHALGRPQLEGFQALCSHGNDAYLLHESSAYELSLFDSVPD